MLFNTLAFWIFFAVVLGVYLLLERRRPQNVFLLSYFFYDFEGMLMTGLLRSKHRHLCFARS